MKIDSDDNSERLNPLDGERLQYLKQFPSPPRGFWSTIPESDWNDWRWQMRNRITSVDAIRRFLPNLTTSEQQGIEWAGTHFGFSITPYLSTLFDPSNIHCPIRIQFIPQMEESVISPGESLDPCAEEPYQVVPWLIHRYPDRVLLLVTNQCAAYCRYCTRSRLVNHEGKGIYNGTAFDKQLAYIKDHKEIRDVLISGGDPFLLSESRLSIILSALRAIPHVEIIRIGTRIPVTLPQRITAELVALLKQFTLLYINIHVNHPSELTIESRAVLNQLADAGIPQGNQSVLLK